MVDSLTRMWVLIGSHLNTRAQAQLVGILPSELSAAVRGQLRRGMNDDVLAEWGELSPAERRVLSGFRAHRSAETEYDEQEEPSEEEQDPPEADDDIEHSPLCAALLSLALLDAPRPVDAASLIVELPLRFQGQIINLIVTSSVFSATWGLERDERDLVEGMREIMTSADSWGVLPACEILRAIDTTRRLRRAISSTAAIDEDAVTILQNHLFVFADVIRLTDRELQALLNRVANQPLARALSDAPDAVRDRLLTNMSPRRSRLVSEEGEFMGELEVEDIRADQRDILETLRELYESGDISTYFGSVRGRGQSTEPEDDGEGDSGLDLSEEGEPEPELGARPASAKEHEQASPRSGRSRLFPILVASIAGTGLMTLLILVVSQFGDDGERRSESEARGNRASGAGSKLDGQVLVQREISDTQSATTRSATTRSATQPAADEADGHADPGGEISAVLEFAGKSGQTTAEVRVDEGSELEEQEAAVDSVDTKSRGDLYLRMGRVSCAVVSETDTFVVRSPLVAVRGAPGAVFAVQVVLDASTTVFVERGQVEVASQRQWSDDSVVLSAGQRQRFEP